MADTLETIGTKIDALSASVDQRFEQVDQRFEQVDRRFEQVDHRFDELKGQLQSQIERVEGKIDLLVEGFANLAKKDAANSAAHRRVDQRLDNHETRLAALEKAPGKKR
jgi:chaperonin cofactor prefoldin